MHACTTHAAGTRSCYTNHGCRCYACAAARSAYGRSLAHRHANGRHGRGTIDAAGAAAHLAELQAAGLGTRRISELSGVSRSALQELTAPGARIHPTTNAAILAVRLPAAGPDERLGAVVHIDATGTRRRLQALAACGWSIGALCTQACLHRQALDRAMNGAPLTTAGTARAVADLYDQVWDAAPPAHTPGHRRSVTITLAAARAAGWPPPAAWDDHALDDPTASPAEQPAPTAASAADRLDDFMHLLTCGEGPVSAARRVGYTARLPLDSIRMAAARADRPDVVTALERAQLAGRTA